MLQKLAFVLILASVFLACSTQGESADVSFRSDVAPILLSNCVACHSAKKAEGGYRVDAFTEMSKAGDSGVAPLAKSNGNAAELVRRLITDDESERMPAEADRLSDDQIKLVTEWVAAGAKFDGENPAALLSDIIPPPMHPSPPETYPASVPITALLLSPDGMQVLTSGYHEVLIWNLDGKLSRRIKNIGQFTYAMALDAKAQKLYVACGQPGVSGEVRMVDFSSGEVLGIVARSTDVILDIAIRPDGKALAVAAADKSIQIVDLETRKITQTLSSHADFVTAVAWTSDGSRLVSASRDKSAKVFDVNSGQLLVSYQGHGAPVRGVSVVSDGKHVVTTGTDNKLHRWNTENAKKVSIVGTGGEGYKLVVGKNSVLVPCSDGRLLKFDLAQNKVAQEFKGHTDGVIAVAMSTDETKIASGSHDGSVKLWNADGSVIGSFIAKP